MKKILIVEDTLQIHNMIKELLNANNFETLSAFSGTEALLILENNKCDLVLLDLMLPGMNGEDVIINIRKYNSIPVIAITAKDDKDTKLEMFKNGVDDYITKPFDIDELICRINALLRRTSLKEKQEELLIYKDIKLNSETFEVYVKDTKINLTKHEYEILKLLMTNPQKVYTKSNIYSSLWNDDFVGEENAINVHISNLRSKLSKINPNEKYIETVWGIGFKMI